MIELKKHFDYILNNYLLPENGTFSSQMEYYKVIVNRIPEEISKIYDNKKYKIYGSCGYGSKSASPYIAISDRKITTSTQRGIYVDFIFKSDMSGFYLTIDQGITSIKEKYGNKVAKEKAQQAAELFRGMISDFKDFESGLVSGHTKSGSLEEGYENTRVIAKYYELNNYTNEEVIEDLNNIMKIYDEIIEKMSGKSYDKFVEEMNGTSWNEVYREIALKTLEFKNNHGALISIMYEILEELGLFNDDDERNCNLDKFNGVRCRYDDIDPFSFMNRLDIFSQKNRKSFIKLFQQKTGLQVNIPDNFDGIPSVNPQNTFLIRFKDDRDENDVSDLWNLFEVAIKYSNDNSEELRKSFIILFDKCIDKPGCSYNITMGLFRIDANFYLNLDRTNRAFIKKEFSIDIKKCPNGEEYLSLIDIIKDRIKRSEEFDSIMDFSKKAWLDKKNEKIQYWTYSPGEGASEWNYCINNNKIVIGWDELGDLAKYNTREELGERMKEIYGKDNPYNDISACDDFINKIQPGDIIIAKTGQKLLLGYGIVLDNSYYYDETKDSFKHIRNVEWKKIGRWEVPNNLKVAQKTLTDITPYDDFAQKLLNIIEGDEIMKETPSEWIIPANPKYYDHEGAFSEFGFIDWSQRVNFNVGDIVYIYSGAPESRISAQTIVERINMSSDETVDDTPFTKTDDLAKKRENGERFVRLKRLKKLDDPRLNYEELARHGLWGRPQSAAHIPEELSEYINNIINGKSIDEYTKESFLKEVFINSEKYDSIVSVLERKKNIILEGAPGVGKTFIAKRLAYSLIGTEDDSKIKIIQFHQNYSYEDFIEGYRPTETGFKLEKGIFYKFCEQAKKDPDNDYYMVIDEINRGNLSKIFGELLMLIENDKRGMKYKLTLAYSKEDFYVPGNLYIIGLMNTADRSLALIDYALRRRFSFIRIEPAFDNDLFIEEFNKKFDEQFDTLIDIIKSINNDIEKDKSLGSGFKIGHSYFLPKLKDIKGNKKDLEDIINFEIVPLLEEYWYDDEDTLIKWKDSLTGYFK